MRYVCCRIVWLAIHAKSRTDAREDGTFLLDSAPFLFVDVHQTTHHHQSIMHPPRSTNSILRVVA
jgi:hypothetical protein